MFPQHTLDCCVACTVAPQGAPLGMLDWCFSETLDRSFQAAPTLLPVSASAEPSSCNYALQKTQLLPKHPAPLMIAQCLSAGSLHLRLFVTRLESSCRLPCAEGQARHKHQWACCSLNRAGGMQRRSLAAVHPCSDTNTTKHHLAPPTASPRGNPLPDILRVQPYRPRTDRAWCLSSLVAHQRATFICHFVLSHKLNSMGAGTYYNSSVYGLKTPHF